MLGATRNGYHLLLANGKFCIDLTRRVFRVNLPIPRASLRLVVVWMGSRSIAAHKEEHERRAVLHNKVSFIRFFPSFLSI